MHSCSWPRPSEPFSALLDKRVQEWPAHFGGSRASMSVDCPPVRVRPREQQRETLRIAQLPRIPVLDNPRLLRQEGPVERPRRLPRLGHEDGERAPVLIENEILTYELVDDEVSVRDRGLLQALMRGRDGGRGQSVSRPVSVGGGVTRRIAFKGSERARFHRCARLLVVESLEYLCAELCAYFS